MRSIYTLDASEFESKTVCLRVEAKELEMLIDILGQYRLNPVDKTFVAYFKQKYVELAVLREKERSWYKLLQMVQTGDFEEAESIITKVCNDARNNYMKYRSDRESLQNALEAKKRIQ